MAGPDLSAARSTIEGMMDDECVVIRNPEGVEDAVLDQHTAELVENDPFPAYSGKCTIRGPGGTAGTEDYQEEGGERYTEDDYVLSLPLSYLEDHPEAEPLKGDWVRVVSSRRDPGLVGKEFRVTRVRYGTFAVSRKAVMTLR